MRRIRSFTRTRRNFETRRVPRCEADRHRVCTSSVRASHLNKTAVSCVYGVQRLTNDYKLSPWQITRHYSCTFGAAGYITTLPHAYAMERHIRSFNRDTNWHCVTRVSCFDPVLVSTILIVESLTCDKHNASIESTRNTTFLLLYEFKI